MATFTHIYFDFFGTLVHYSRSHRGASHEGSYRILAGNGAECSYERYVLEWDRTFEIHARQASQSLEEFSMDELCLHFLSTRLPIRPDADLIATFRDAYLHEWSQGVSYIPGLDAMLDELASTYRLGIVSNTHHEQLVLGLLEDAGLQDFFSNITTSVGHGRRKPCPTIYQEALSAIGARADRAVFVGDSMLHDYVGPRTLGLHALLIDPDATERIPGEHRLHRILELPRRIAF